MDPKNKVQNSYKNFLHREGTRPPTFEAFCDFEELQGIDVLDYYGSFARIDRDIVLGTFQETLARLAEAEEYYTYIAREKILAFFYTWFEELGEIRQLLHTIDQGERTALYGATYLKGVEKPFKQYIENVLAEGMENGEVASRELLQSQYGLMFWIELRFLLHYWLNDESKDFVQSDAAVEKSVNFAFDLIAPNVLDSGLDLVKFLLKR